ncbi:MAG TPA: hypothetical protein VM120_16160 [Bryobacteraceae bacterium]|nr:hypothetical protein [Bryobacteraceae bacterium]
MRRFAEEVWRIGVDGRDATQITRNGAEFGVESADGESLYYARQGELWMENLRDGREEKMVAGMAGRNFMRGPDGIYFVLRRGDAAPAVERILADGRREVVLPAVGTPSDRIGAMALSPDRKWLLFERVDQSDSEVMVVTGLQ